MNKNCNLKSWKCVRQMYSCYSYAAFLCLAAYQLDDSVDAKHVSDIVVDKGLESREVVGYICGLPEAEIFLGEMLSLISGWQEMDINALYQEYLAQDYRVLDGKFTFGHGKDNRDILGAYYTQEDFAAEITAKAMEEYVKGNGRDKDGLRIADFSCGGGAFLAAACKYCSRDGRKVILYGYDVDPIAVLITRLRLAEFVRQGICSAYIYLGNPLIHMDSRVNAVELFRTVSRGEFYHCNMGVVLKEKMDVIVGNPPWEKIRFEEKKFLQHYAGKERIGTKSERELFLSKVSKENFEFFKAISAEYDAAKVHIKSGNYFVDSSCGELNTYALFTELSLNSLGAKGVIGLIVKASLVKMPVYSGFFRHMLEKKNLYELYMFVNKKKIFHIDSREEFSVIYLKNENRNEPAVALNLEEYKDFSHTDKLVLPEAAIRLLNPETSMVPNIRSNKELRFLMSIYENNRTFGERYPECRFGRLVHLTNHSENIIKEKKDGYEAIYEGKFIELYTEKYATFRDMPEGEKYKDKASARLIGDVEGEEYPESRFFIDSGTWQRISRNFGGEYVVAWRSLTSATNRRTMLASMMPLMPTCQSIQLLQLNEEADMVRVLSVFNSIIFDYIARMKMVGLDLTQTIIKQIPVPEDSGFLQTIEFGGKMASIDMHINSRVYALYRNDERLVGCFGKFKKYEIEREKTRKELIAELDQLVAILYHIAKPDLKAIALSFDKYYTRDEVEMWF